MLDLDAIKARVEAATPGPWEAGDVWAHKDTEPGSDECAWCPRLGPPVKVFSYPHMTRHVHRCEPCDRDLGRLISGPDAEHIVFSYDNGFERRENVEFVVHARKDIPELIAEVERLRAELAEKG
jgi:hypothetical protein